MTPQEKAKELVEKFDKEQTWAVAKARRTEASKRCALVAVDEIIDNLVTMVKTTLNSPVDVGLGYWQEVKKEIEKL